MSVEKEDSKKNEVNFSDKLDVLKYLGDVKLGLKAHISNDYVLAKLGDKDKEMIVEMFSNALFSKKLILAVLHKAKRNKYVLTQKDIIECQESADRVFEEFMKRIEMTIVLNRNIDGNYIVNVLSEYEKANEEKTLETNPQGTVGQVLGEKPEDKKK